MYFTQGIRCTADVRSSETFDFETETSVSLLFYAVDNEGSKIIHQTTLTISDANDAPSVSFILYKKINLLFQIYLF